MDNWMSALKFDPIPVLLSSRSTAINVLTNRDLLSKKTEPIQSLWELKEVKSALRRQQANGSWRYPGGGGKRIKIQ